MKTNMTNLIAIVTLGAISLAASTSFACGGGSIKFGGYGGYGGYSSNKVYVKKVYVEPVVSQPVFEASQPVVVQPAISPLHSFAFVYPGETWSTLSQREFGKPIFGDAIASFNGMNTSVQLIVGQQLRLPTIQPSGQLTESNAPAPAPFALQQPQFGGAPMQNAGMPPQGFQGQPMQGQQFGNPSLQGTPQGMPQGNPGMQFAPQGQNGVPAMPVGFNGQPAPQAPQGLNGMPQNGAPQGGLQNGPIGGNLPSVAVDSILALDGQMLGNDQGQVRLAVNGMALPVDILEWSVIATKIHLPKIDLQAPVQAEILIIRADGSLASKSPILLTPAVTRLAMSN